MHDPYEGIDADGMITTGVARSKVPSVFEPVVRSVSDHLASMAPTGSLYLYGSAATGQAEQGSSDLDFLAVDVPRHVIGWIELELGQQFGTVARELAFVRMSAQDLAGDGDRAYGNRAFLRHYCVHLEGPDPAADMGPVPADARAARGFNGDIAQHHARWLSDLPASMPAILGRKVGRKTLLALAGIVSVCDGIWTTDREVAAERWVGLHPDRAREISQLFAWSAGLADADVRTLTRALMPRGVVSAITDEFAARVGLWADD